MQNAGHANLRAEAFGIGGDGRHCFCRCLKQQAIDGALVPICDTGDLGRQREHHMEVFHGQQIFGSCRHPVTCCRSLTFGTVAVLARVVSDMLVLAFGARGHMPAERLGSAGLNGGHHFELGQADMPSIGPPPRRTMGAEDVSNLQRGFGQLAGAYPGRSRRPSMFSFLSASNGLGVSLMVLVATWV